MALRGLNRSEVDADAGASERSPVILFEQEVPVLLRLEGRDAVHQHLGLHVATGRGGANGTTRCVNVRLTDPQDAFFLFTLSMLEDDYGRFKEAHELNVDFGGFPRHLVSMLAAAAARPGGGTLGRGSSSSNGGGGATAAAAPALEFVGDTTHSGKLRVVEKTEFRQIEMLTLLLHREGDIGQKRYLAERFHHFEQAFLRARAEAEEHHLEQAAHVAELQGALEAVRAERDGLRDRLNIETSAAASAQAASLAEVKDEHARELRRLQVQHEGERTALVQRLDALQQQAVSEGRTRDAELAAARTRIATLEASAAHLDSQLRVAQETGRSHANEAARLRQDNEELAAYRASASKTLTERELAAVSLQEQLRHLRESLEKREGECAEYRQQGDKRDQYSQVLADQLRVAQEKLGEHDASLKKAHHIIGTQLQQLKGLKDRQRSLVDQLAGKERLLADAHATVERLKAAAATSSERVDHFQAAVSALKEQLQKVEDEKRALTEELTGAKDALAHMYKTASGVTSRIYSGSGGGVGGVSTSALYSEFSRNMSVGGNGTGGFTAPSSAPAAAGGGKLGAVTPAHLLFSSSSTAAAAAALPRSVPPQAHVPSAAVAPSANTNTTAASFAPPARGGSAVAPAAASSYFPQ